MAIAGLPTVMVLLMSALLAPALDGQPLRLSGIWYATTPVEAGMTVMSIEDEADHLGHALVVVVRHHAVVPHVMTTMR